MPTPDFMFLSNISLFCQHAVVLSVAMFPLPNAEQRLASVS